ncbi:MAG: class I SAM-dependent methyltransferase [Gallionella sp.]|jgi:extracellular factor (EF) 3-hydroxypalmitic acid methyl ester biosynthesis protein
MIQNHHRFTSPRNEGSLTGSCLDEIGVTIPDSCQIAFQYLFGLVKKSGPVPSDYEELTKTFRLIMKGVRNGEIAATQLHAIWPVLGNAFSPKTMHGLALSMPYGYAGDFEIIDKIYTRCISPDPHLANWDNYFHWNKATHAVRNRKQYFLSLLDNLGKHHDNQFRVLNIGSGPGRDVLEYCNSGKNNVAFDCLDQDARAISYARKLCHDFLEHIEFHQKNVMRFRPSRQYHLIWSAGLFDYFDDRVFQRLIKRLHPFVQPGGQLVIGNFSPSNPSRDYMECANWALTHRDENHLINLAMACGISHSQISIGREPAGVNLFLHIHA